MRAVCSTTERAAKRVGCFLVGLLASFRSGIRRISRGAIGASSFIPLNPIELRSVLVATDLTESADKALEHGIAIARHYHATLYIVHVVSSRGFTIAGPEAVELAAEATERDIDSVVNQLMVSGKLNGVEAQPIVLKGNADLQMESFVRAHRVDMIVVGTHGRQGMSRFFSDRSLNWSQNVAAARS